MATVDQRLKALEEQAQKLAASVDLLKEKIVRIEELIGKFIDVEDPLSNDPRRG